jgi:hypothetical protein
MTVIENAKEKERLFRYTRELENVRDNMEILFENRDKLDSNEKEVEEYIKNEDKEIKKLTRYQQISKNTTRVGGALTLFGSVVSGGLKSSEYSHQGDILLLVNSGVGGFLTLTGSFMENYYSEKAKSQQEEKKEREIEKAKKVSEKSVRDFNRLKDN